MSWFKKVPVLLELCGYKDDPKNANYKLYTIGCLVCQTKAIWRIDHQGYQQYRCTCRSCGATNTMSEMQTGKRLRLLQARSTMCRHCKLPPLQHADEKKCLFMETSYEPIGDDGLDISHV